MVETLYSEMGNRGVRPDVSIFNILIKALCKAHQGFVEEGDMDGVIRILKQLEEFDCTIGPVTVNLLLHGYVKEGRVEETLKLTEEMCGLVYDLISSPPIH
ncbi:hypothetical protein AMTR_s00001p00269940 [Amborella trichopoda]|uniref:Pentacotripeptide-repeat region of PRORP domain-containing protein n=1 Tax=Amborella trichopoda TaxID=13333 RepID=W1NM09_AMBTC|nr:hypothetical protein AMTR_s00001p00269940 [Amborella trichopoda]